MSKIHNTHYATEKELSLLVRRAGLNYLRALVIRDLGDHIYDGTEKTSGYRSALFGVLGALDSLLGVNSL